jgi:hypothetical protein
VSEHVCPVKIRRDLLAELRLDDEFVVFNVTSESASALAWMLNQAVAQLRLCDHWAKLGLGSQSLTEHSA